MSFYLCFVIARVVRHTPYRISSTLVWESCVESLSTSLPQQRGNLHVDVMMTITCCPVLYVLFERVLRVYESHIITLIHKHRYVYTGTISKQRCVVPQVLLLLLWWAGMMVTVSPNLNVIWSAMWQESCWNVFILSGPSVSVSLGLESYVVAFETFSLSKKKKRVNINLNENSTRASRSNTTGTIRFSMCPDQKSGQDWTDSYRKTMVERCNSSRWKISRTVSRCLLRVGYDRRCLESHWDLVE